MNFKEVMCEGVYSINVQDAVVMVMNRQVP
jgi:hypothetical protein